MAQENPSDFNTYSAKATAMLGEHWNSRSILLDSVLRRTAQRSTHNVSNGPVGFGLYREPCLHLRRMPDPCRMGSTGMSASG